MSQRNKNSSCMYALHVRRHRSFSSNTQMNYVWEQHRLKSMHGCRKGAWYPPGLWNRYFPNKISAKKLLFSSFQAGKIKFHHSRHTPRKTLSATLGKIHYCHPPWKKFFRRHVSMYVNQLISSVLGFKRYKSKTRFLFAGNETDNSSKWNAEK